MADYRPYQDMNFRFAKVLEDLAKTWPAKDIASIQDLVSHSEYGEAMECLLALAVQNGKGVTTAQSAALADMGKALGVPMPATKPTPSSPAPLSTRLPFKRQPHPG